jgi:hypothetical protein
MFHQVLSSLKVDVAHFRAIPALIARPKLKSLFPINSNLKRPIRQYLVSKRLQTLRHAFLQLLIIKAKIQSIRHNSYSSREILARVLNKVARDKLRFPLLAISESGVVEDPNVVQSRVDGLGFLPSVEVRCKLVCITRTSTSFTYGNVIGNRSKRSGSQDLSSSGTSGDQGEERSMPPAWSTSTATRRPWETTSLKKFIVQ